MQDIDLSNSTHFLCWRKLKRESLRSINCYDLKPGLEVTGRWGSDDPGVAFCPHLKFKVILAPHEMKPLWAISIMHHKPSEISGTWHGRTSVMELRSITQLLLSFSL